MEYATVCASTYAVEAVSVLCIAIIKPNSLVETTWEGNLQVFEREGVLNEREEILDWEGMGWDRKDRCLGLDPECR